MTRRKTNPQSATPGDAPRCQLERTFCTHLLKHTSWHPNSHITRNHSFTWLNSRLQPVEIPAYEYLTLVQRYISGKIDDANIFPTAPEGVSFADNPAFCTPVPDSGEDWVGKRSGFPRNFMETCQTIFRQMF